jgi:hypothetical protein
MSILLLLSLIFHMWETVLVEWENYNILDKIGDVPTGWKIRVWLPFEFERKTTREVGSRSSHEDNHYP